MQVPRIYAIADAGRWAPRPLPDVVAELAAAGWPWIQVRDKHSDDRQLLRQAEACVAAAGEASVWINDRADIAALAGARGVHVGDGDPPPEALRKLFPELWIGRTTRDQAGVSAAEASPAVDLIAFGPVFSTHTKGDVPEPRGVDALNSVRDLTDKPIVAIGGIDGHAIPDLRWAGANVVAVTGVLATNPALVTEWVSRYAVAARITWPRVYLTGFMAVGKSCVGRRIAAVLGWKFVDLDAMVTAGTDMTIPELFSVEGEEAFRDRESQVLAQACAQREVVVACGGGVLDREQNQRLLEHDEGLVVWLDVAESEIERRLSPSGRMGRPRADKDWRDLLADRRPVYAEFADCIVPVADPEPIRRTARRTWDRITMSETVGTSA